MQLLNLFGWKILLSILNKENATIRERHILIQQREGQFRNEYFLSTLCRKHLLSYLDMHVFSLYENGRKKTLNNFMKLTILGLKIRKRQCFYIPRP